ncbi:MAG: hypothetical protein J6B89_03550 [Bacilli bacterium]|nr:hypothetical protein [Bacilli bacterium]
MFNFRNKEEKKYKGSTIYVMKHEDANVEDLLAIIVRNIERYVEQEHRMPNKLRLSYENYNRILEHNKSLIEKRGNKYYTFGVEIEV